MGDWHLNKKRLKKYPHFDPIVSVAEAQALANDSKRVAAHSFFPFLRYTKRWTRYAKEGKQGKPKDRPIRYAARRDAYIFARYRHVLSELYEEELTSLGLGGCVLAYRRILNEDGSGKCNIHFARDAFQSIRDAGDCLVLALDISSYFESLDHARLKTLWCRLLRTDRLPSDHFHVFRTITRYAVVDKLQVYERLGHYGEKRKSKVGKAISGYITPYKAVPKQLCRGSEFRNKIAGGNGEKSIIQVNRKPYGIPQGAPISDLLANLYLIDFDAAVNQMAVDAGGSYFRYSDDILIVVPGNADAGITWLANIQAILSQHGERLVIKPEKSTVFAYRREGESQTFSRIHGVQGRNGLEYLGFRYNGRYIYIRDSTLSGLRRKVALAARRDANAHAMRNEAMPIQDLQKSFNYERLIKKFGRVEDFREKQEDFRNWTFWTYARRAANVFGPLGKPILKQLKRHSSLVRRRAEEEIIRAVARRQARADS